MGAAAPGRGLAQGAVLSPLLANVYLHLLDVTLIRARLALVRYADDAVLCSAKTVTGIQDVLEAIVTQLPAISNPLLPWL